MLEDNYCQALINSIPDPIMVIEQGCSISMVNDALLELQNDARENVIGRSCFKILHHQEYPCQMPDGECPYIEVFESGRSIKVTHRHYTSQNQEIIVELTASPLKDKNGKVMRMLEMMRDVTGQSRAEEENRQSFEFLASVLEGIGEGVVVMDRDFRIISANKGYLQQVGLDRDEVVGGYCYNVSHHFDSPCSRHGHDCPVKTVFDTGMSARAMHTHYDHHNYKVFVECHAYPIKDSSGSVIRAIETLNDVTNRVLLEHKVKESEEKFRDLYDNAPDGHYSLNGERLIVEVNRTFLNMLGYTREEVVNNKNIDDLLSKTSSLLCSKIFPQFMKGEKISNIELAMIKKDGSILPVVMNATAVLEADGRFVMSRSVVRDITDRKRVDDEKRRLQEQLFQSQKLEALGTLAGGIAHDFNNLLASIMGYSSLAKADLKEDDPVFRHVDIIETASHRASELTQRLLAFARGGKHDPKPNDVNAVIQEVVALLSRTIDKGIAIDVNTAKDLKLAICDSGQVQQALLNICINARDAMPQGGRIAIGTSNRYFDIDEVEAFVDVPPGEYVCITVSDTGMGIDSETRKYIFDPFFTTKEKGTGLGLSVVYGIVKKHNGFINVYSEPGRGSMFKISLPACVSEDTCVKEKEKVALRHGTETILVVDDEPAIKDLARDILKKFGYNVLVAGGGEDAITLYQHSKGEIKIVLLDMVMPKMNGREVFQRIREINPSARVIVSSGYSHDRDADDLLGQGAAGFVQKPYRMADLLKAVEKALEEK